MIAIKKARDLLERADTNLIGMSPNLEQVAAQRDLARAWLDLARVQHATGTNDPAPAPAAASQKDPRVVDAPQTRRQPR